MKWIFFLREEKISKAFCMRLGYRSLFRSSPTPLNCLFQSSRGSTIIMCNIEQHGVARMMELFGRVFREMEESEVNCVITIFIITTLFRNVAHITAYTLLYTKRLRMIWYERKREEKRDHPRTFSNFMKVQWAEFLLELEEMLESITKWLNELKSSVWITLLYFIIWVMTGGVTV